MHLFFNLLRAQVCDDVHYYYRCLGAEVYKHFVFFLIA